MPHVNNNSFSAIKMIIGLSIRKYTLAGITLVEFLTTIAIVSVLVLIATGSYFFMVQNQREIASENVNLEENKLATRVLTSLAQADISTYFLNLPIPTRNCSDSEPCVYYWDLDEQKLVPLSNQDFGYISADYVQLFSDRSNQVSTTDVFNRVGEKVAQTPFLQKLELSNLPRNRHYYACWPLLPNNNRPLVLLKKHSFSKILVLDSSTATSSPGSNWILVRSSSPLTTEEIQMIGQSYLLIFNSLDPRHFGIAAATEMRSCAQQSQFCQNEFSRQNFSNQEYAIQIRGLNSSDYQHFPRSDVIRGWQTWMSGDAHPMLPSLWTLIKPGDPDLSSPFNPRKIEHFYHAHNLPSQINLLPFEINRYRAELVNNGSIRIINEIIMSGRLISSKIEYEGISSGVRVCRQIGSFKVNVFF